MLLVLLTMLLILVLAGLVAAYMVFPRRGVDVPRLPWATPLLARTVRALPTLDNSLAGSASGGRRRVR